MCSQHPLVRRRHFCMQLTSNLHLVCYGVVILNYHSPPRLSSITPVAALLQLFLGHAVAPKQGHVVELMSNTAQSQSVYPASDNGTAGRSATMENEGSYRAKRYALKYQPPCIFLEYEDTTKRRRVRAVRTVPNFDQFSYGLETKLLLL